MTTVDVAASIDIAADPTDIAAVMFDPSREPDWMRAVTAVEILDPALAPGARVRHTATVMGHEFVWVSEVERVQFPHVLVFRLAEGPFSGTLQYGIQRAGMGSRVQIRGAGQSEAAGSLPASLLAGPINAALARDLERLKALVETV
jgi:hypothetical protein